MFAFNAQSREVNAVLHSLLGPYIASVRACVRACLLFVSRMCVRTLLLCASSPSVDVLVEVSVEK